MSELREGRRPSVLGANALFLVAAAALALLNLLGEPLTRGIYALFPSASPEGAALLVNAVYYLPFMLLPVLMYARREPDGAPRMRLNPVSFRGTVAIVLTAFLGVVLVTELSLWWTMLLEALGLDTSHQQVLIPSNTRGLLLYMAATAVLPGVCEELLFRGALLPAWERRGARRAVVYTSLLFAALHGSLTGLPAELLLGAVIACVVIAFDSVYAGMIYHTAHNAIVLLANFALRRFSHLFEGAPGVSEEAALSGGEIASMVLQFSYYFLLFGGMLLIFRRRKLRHAIESARDTGVRMNAAELSLLAAGLLFALVLYWVDLSQLLGAGGGA